MHHDQLLTIGAVTLLVAALFHYRTMIVNHARKQALMSALFVILCSALYLLYLPIVDVFAVSAQLIITFFAIPEPWHTKRRARRAASVMIAYGITAVLTLPLFINRG